MTQPKTIGRREFDLPGQRRFARLSGDYNPIHLDVEEARRSMFGQPIVHGLHLVASALELFLSSSDAWDRGKWQLSAVSAKFHKPAFLDETIAFQATSATDQEIRIRASASGMSLAEISFRIQRASDQSHRDVTRNVEYPFSQPVTREVDELMGRSGTAQIQCLAGEVAQDFPVSSSAVGVDALIALMALSRLVGMECPGLHSLFAALDVELSPDAVGTDLEYGVESLDTRFSAVLLNVSGANLRGTVRAFLRPPPVAQSSMATISQLVAANSFSDQCALVVGGSRGLGELTAKIVACGGGRVILTYSMGKQDAVRVDQEITEWGGNCSIARLDVGKPSAAIAEIAGSQGAAVSHIYYFATPKIFQRSEKYFSSARHRQFSKFYVSDFLKTYEACRKYFTGHLSVYYPSTVAIDECIWDLTEYAAAKAAGETAARQLETLQADTDVYIERLPRLQTDQTNTLLPIATEDAGELLYKSIRQFSNRREDRE